MIIVLNCCIYLGLGVVLLEKRKSSLLPICVELVLRHQRLVWLVNQCLNVLNILVSVDSIVSKVLVVLQIF